MLNAWYEKDYPRTTKENSGKPIIGAASLTTEGLNEKWIRDRRSESVRALDLALCSMAFKT